MDDEKIRDKIRAAVGPDGKIRCVDAFQVAEETGVPVQLVGKRINELGIRIKGCQLGCFS